MSYNAFFYGLAHVSAWEGKINVASDTFKCSLHTSSYAINQDTHQYWDVSVTNEISGTGYTAGGATIGSPTATYADVSGTKTFTFDGADITSAWASNVNPSQYAVVYDSTPGSNKPLVAFVDFGAPLTLTSLTFSANGIATVTIAGGS